MKKIRLFSLFILALILPLSANAQIKLPFSKWWEPAGLEVFKKAYPHIKFISSYDKTQNDWIIHIFTPAKENRPAKEVALYWCEGRFLPKEYLDQKEKYRKMLYTYPKQVPNPKDFSEQDIERIKNFTSKENRANGPIDPPFLFNAIYDLGDREQTEKHIKTYYFLDGKRTVNVHEDIYEPLKRVSQRIMKLEQEEEIKNFFATLERTDGFNWRSVRDTESRSFHSIGLAIDILPKGYYQKSIYWAWQKQWQPDSWYMLPLEKRWSPPQRIIQIFEEEGFIWGGKWIVWDNMHFEYHPELILAAMHP